MMKKKMVLVLFSGFLAAGLVYPANTRAEVNLNIAIPLPGLVLPAPPAMVVIPGTYVYFAPDVRHDLFFYRGYWYRPYRGEWYYSVEYNGPWGRVAFGNVPPPLINLPPDYRHPYPGYGRMPYQTVQRNWRHWEEERYWDYYGQRGPRTPRRGHGMGMGMGRHGG